MSKRSLGIKLLSIGAKLVFSSDDDRDKLKHTINADTWIGAMSESGGHLLADVQPMNEYDTQSVINVLKHSKLDAEVDSSSKKIQYYKEEWKL